MDLNPYLAFDGTCEEALSFYAGVFGSEVTNLMRYSDMPDMPGVSGALSRKVAHARVAIGGKTLMASDHAAEFAGAFPGYAGFNLQIGFDTVEKARAIFDALSDGGSVTMPFEPTFWAAGFGMCRDKFGVPWMVNCDQPAGDS